eukprot:3433045-Rhodomonas_salina.2
MSDADIAYATVLLMAGECEGGRKSEKERETGQRKQGPRGGRGGISSQFAKGVECRSAARRSAGGQWRLRPLSVSLGQRRLGPGLEP